MEATVEATETVGLERSGRSERSYYPELDGLRFWAFLLVFFFHGGVPGAELASLLGSEAARAVRSNGWVGVQLFFVLSGYLITTLLLREERRYGRVDLKAFWVRRILRIWPLYYLIVGIGFLVYPMAVGQFGTEGHRALVATHLLPFLTFTGNWSMAFHGPANYDMLGVLWSVCVEEQFYVACPLLIAWLAPRWRIPLVVAAIVGSMLYRGWLAAGGASSLAIQFNTLAQVDTLFSGVLLALLLGPSPESRPNARRAARIGQWLAPVALGWLICRPDLGREIPARWVWDYAAFWLASAFLIATAVLHDGWLRASLADPRLVMLGRISYGLYMYHEIAFAMRAPLSSMAGWFPNNTATFAVLTLAMTIGLAATSYRWFERPFLSLKVAWTRVASRPI